MGDDDDSRTRSRRGRGGREAGRRRQDFIEHRSRGGSDGRSRGHRVFVADIPFEFVGEVASASAVAETSHVESLATSRHDVKVDGLNPSTNLGNANDAGEKMGVLRSRMRG